VKISSSLRIVAPEPRTTWSATSTQRRELPAGERSALSAVGSYAGELRAEAARFGIEGEVRPGIVEQMRAEIAAGRLGTPADIERALDALLEEL